jgi:hypothetical protein
MHQRWMNHGKVKEIYMRYVTLGDQFVGRCLCLLSVLRSDFAVSPTLFVSPNFDWIEPCWRSQFPMVNEVVGMKKLLNMCLASILYHHGWLLAALPANHVFLAWPVILLISKPCSICSSNLSLE